MFEVRGSGLPSTAKQESSRFLASISTFLLQCCLKLSRFRTVKRKAKTLYVNMLKSQFCLYTR